ncbi:MAG: hypothetical protein R3D67_00295 [Hyphomicrobiaceae bacterium]
MKRTEPNGVALGVLGLLTGAAMALAGCSAGTEFQSEVRPHVRCVDDSPGCVSQRQAALKAMLADPKHRWVHDHADADAYATGVRLFAFKTRKRELSCTDLKKGRHEAEAGAGTLRGPGGRHLTPAQVSRGVMFAGEVSRELAKELRRRCRA